MKAPLLVANTAWIMAGFAVRVLLQGLTFLAVARTLGASGYGVFASTLAVAAIFSPFAGLGMGNVLVQQVARSPASFPVYWGRALVTIVVSGVILAGPLILVATLVLPTSSLVLVGQLAVAELVFARVVDAGSRAFIAFDRGRETAMVSLLLFTLRATAAAVLITGVAGQGVLAWAGLYLGSAGVAAGVTLALVGQRLGGPRLLLRVPWSEVRLGALFSIGLSAQNVYNDADKVMLARLASTQVAGVYAAAYRVVDMSFAPVSALLHATFATFFRQGVGGIRGSLAFARRVIPWSMGYGIVVALLLFLGAPALVPLLGRDFAEMVQVLRWLAFLPILRAAHYFVADALTGAGRQGIRSSIQIISATLNVVLNLLLIPRYSWQGAVGATLISEMTLALSLTSLAWWISRVERARS